ncbi:hypothetical protein PR048_025993 [Dryococelus australis]|uniref:Uncharacterized protein n=1 Tax=Dryococelus australis TaxID=614101 RepID=A0ABQ9GK46_9NEOP|nr:hypothetical protein PR048_025993 [Dryococelus australis]
MDYIFCDVFLASDAIFAGACVYCTSAQLSAVHGKVSTFEAIVTFFFRAIYILPPINVNPATFKKCSLYRERPITALEQAFLAKCFARTRIADRGETSRRTQQFYESSSFYSWSGSELTRSLCRRSGQTLARIREREKERRGEREGGINAAGEGVSDAAASEPRRYRALALRELLSRASLINCTRGAGRTPTPKGGKKNSTSAPYTHTRMYLHLHARLVPHRSYAQGVQCFRRNAVIEVSSTEQCRNEGAGEREIPEKTRRPAASSGTIPTCENPGVTQLGIEPDSALDEYSVKKLATLLAAQRRLAFSAARSELSGRGRRGTGGDLNCIVCFSKNTFLTPAKPRRIVTCFRLLHSISSIMLQISRASAKLEVTAKGLQTCSVPTVCTALKLCCVSRKERGSVKDGRRCVPHISLVSLEFVEQYTDLPTKLRVSGVGGGVQDSVQRGIGMWTYEGRLSRRQGPCSIFRTTERDTKESAATNPAETSSQILTPESSTVQCAVSQRTICRQANEKGEILGDVRSSAGIKGWGETGDPRKNPFPSGIVSESVDILLNRFASGEQLVSQQTIKKNSRVPAINWARTSKLSPAVVRPHAQTVLTSAAFALMTRLAAAWRSRAVGAIPARTPLGQGEPGGGGGDYFAGAHSVITPSTCFDSTAQGATVAERLTRSPPTKAIRVQSPAGSLRIFACGNRWPAGLSRGSPVSPALSFRCYSILTTNIHIGSQDLDVKSRPNFFTHSTVQNRYLRRRFEPRTSRTAYRRRTNRLRNERSAGLLTWTCSVAHWLRATLEDCSCRYEGNTARLAHRSDKTLGVRSVARIALSLLDNGRADPLDQFSEETLINYGTKENIFIAFLKKIRLFVIKFVLLGGTTENFLDRRPTDCCESLSIDWRKNRRIVESRSVDAEALFDQPSPTFSLVDIPSETETRPVRDVVASTSATRDSRAAVILFVAATDARVISSPACRRAAACHVCTIDEDTLKDVHDKVSTLEANLRRKKKSLSPQAYISMGALSNIRPYQLGSLLVDDRPIMNAAKYRVVSGVVWTNITMVGSNTDTNRTGVLAVVDIDLNVSTRTVTISMTVNVLHMNGIYDRMNFTVLYALEPTSFLPWPVVIGRFLLEKAFSDLTGPLRIRQHRHGSYMIRLHYSDERHNPNCAVEQHHTLKMT